MTLIESMQIFGKGVYGVGNILFVSREVIWVKFERIVQLKTIGNHYKTGRYIQ